MIATLILICGIIGLVDSAAFGFMMWECQRTNECGPVSSSPDARLLGIPNSWIGMAWFLLVIVWASASLTAGAPLYPAPAAAAAALPVVLGIYLTWSLLYKIRTVCRMCFLAHACNLIIFICVLISLRQ